MVSANQASGVKLPRHSRRAFHDASIGPPASHRLSPVESGVRELPLSRGEGLVARARSDEMPREVQFIQCQDK
jgi:hypothetical protein